MGLPEFAFGSQWYSVSMLSPGPQLQVARASALCSNSGTQTRRIAKFHALCRERTGSAGMRWQHVIGLT